MDKQRKRELKAQARQTMKEESEQLERALAESIPVDIQHPEWGRYYKRVVTEERRLRDNTTQVFRGHLVGRSISVVNSRTHADGRLLPVPGLYFMCDGCSDLIPLAASRRLACSCGRLSHGPVAAVEVFQPIAGTKIVKLIPITRLRRWWEFWR